MSLHLNASACPSPIEERKWRWVEVVGRGSIRPSKASFNNWLEKNWYLRYQNCNIYLEHRLLSCVERKYIRIFDRALFDSLWEVANVSLEGDAYKRRSIPKRGGGNLGHMPTPLKIMPNEKFYGNKRLIYYASPSSGDAYNDRQLTTNFELWIKISCAPTYFHIRIP